MTRALALAALLVAAAGCIPEEGPMMEPGSDCMECHDGGDARRWTLAGTMNETESELLIVDAAGKTFTRHTNRVGNVWTSEPVTFPITVSINGQVMQQKVQASSRGSCNLAGCHAGAGGGGN
jgi:hypothetical protein